MQCSACGEDAYRITAETRDLGHAIVFLHPSGQRCAEPPGVDCPHDLWRPRGTEGAYEVQDCVARRGCNFRRRALKAPAATEGRAWEFYRAYRPDAQKLLARATRGI